MRAEIPLSLGFQSSLPSLSDAKYDNKDILQEARLRKTWDCVIQEGSAARSPHGEALTQTCGRMGQGPQSSLCVLT